MSEQNLCQPSAYVRWSDEETRVLISIIREEGVMRQLDRPKLRNSFVYQKVVDALSNQGIERTVPQTRDKFKKLKQSYLQERARRSRLGEEGRSQFRFWEEMNCLLGQRAVASVTACLIDTSQPSMSAASCTSPNQGSSTSTTLPALSQSAVGASSQFGSQHAEWVEELCNPDAPSVELQEEDIEIGTSVGGPAPPALHAQSGVVADRARRQQYPSAAEYRQSSLMETRLLRRQMQATAARQQMLFQQAERRRQRNWARWMRQQHQQHQQMVAMFSEFLQSIAETSRAATVMVDVGTDPVPMPSVSSSGRG
ncbi:uncharacterized protein LOC121308794 isoform X2 [Polyodon spathula]|uniref:uncharacterized protein LOC121308794 isoform X2 n=1 Tax=Polyodon spathula TaxID=7913 RepID=UPI001B7ECE02|nr:uncharacterized protein LOC121308794 isoform X2 [Polyodon spathula]